MNRNEDSTKGWYIDPNSESPIIGRYNFSKESMFRIEPLGYLPEEEDDIAPYLVQISPTMERYIYSIPCTMFRKLFGKYQWRVDKDSELCFVHSEVQDEGEARHIVLLSANDNCAYEIHVQVT